MEEINYNILINKRQTLEINPYYRFDHILSDFLDPNIMEKRELREKIFNIIIHILSNIDLQEGLNKRLILSRLIINDIENGVFGEKVNGFFRELNKKEKMIIAGGLQDKYKYDRELEVFKKVFKKIYPDSIIYDSLDDEEKLVLFINYENTKKNKQKEKVVEMLFLPTGLKTKIFWKKHFGVIGVEETMVIGEIAIY